MERPLTRWLATRAALTVRLETGGALATDVPDPDSGGAVLYATTDFVFRPVFQNALRTLPRLSASVGVTFPLVQGFFGVHRESAVAGTSLSLSL